MLIFSLVLILITQASAEISEDSFIVAGCSVFKRDGKLERIFPGRNCFFGKNGELVSTTDQGIRIFSPSDGHLIWERALNGRFRVELSQDRERILLIEPLLDQTIDRLRILNFRGEVQHEVSSDYFRNDPNSCITSFFDIPHQSKNRFLHEGDFIVADAAGNFYVLSADLKRIRKKFLSQKKPSRMLVDVQVNQDGKIFYLNKKPDANTQFRSTVAYEEFDPESKKVFQQFPEKLDFSFLIPAGGGASPVDDDQLVITHPLSGSYVFSRESLKLISFIPGMHMVSEGCSPVNRVRIENLKEDLKKWAP